MSVEAITWAINEPVTPSSMKFVLVILANCASPDTFEAFPSAAYLAEATAQDRKTVQANIRRLVELGYIVDTTRRTGRTRQVIVYRLNCPNSGLIKGDRIRASSNRPNFPAKEARFSPETGPKTGDGNQRKPKEPNTPQPPAGGQPGFDEFFVIFPKQVDEAKARDQWDRLAPDDALRAAIMASVLEWRSSVQWTKEGGSLIPKPHNWLRNKGWRNVPGIAPLPRKERVAPPAAAPPAPMPAGVVAAAAKLLGSRAKSSTVRASALARESETHGAN